MEMHEVKKEPRLDCQWQKNDSKQMNFFQNLFVKPGKEPQIEYLAVQMEEPFIEEISKAIAKLKNKSSRAR